MYAHVRSYFQQLVTTVHPTLVQWCSAAGAYQSSVTSTSERWVVATKYMRKCPAELRNL